MKRKAEQMMNEVKYFYDRSTVPVDFVVYNPVRCGSFNRIRRFAHVSIDGLDIPVFNRDELERYRISDVKGKSIDRKTPIKFLNAEIVTQSDNQKLLFSIKNSLSPDPNEARICMSMFRKKFPEKSETLTHPAEVEEPRLSPLRSENEVAVIDEIKIGDSTFQFNPDVLEPLSNVRSSVVSTPPPTTISDIFTPGEEKDDARASATLGNYG